MLLSQGESAGASPTTLLTASTSLQAVVTMTVRKESFVSGNVEGL